MVGLFSGFTPTFVKRYAEAGQIIRDAVASYAAEVRGGQFPSGGQSFGMKDDVVKRLYGS
jgi:3-methyl-2-oxobutanoate hydroxymethyltransferase